MVTLVAGDSGYEKYILVLEVNCMHKRPEPKSYLSTDNPQNICKRVTTTAFQKYDAFVVILSQMFSGLYPQDEVVDDWEASSLVVLCN